MTARLPAVRKPGTLLQRLLDAPDLPRAVQALEPAALHRLVHTCGLEECGPILALASTEELVAVFDEDLWPRAEPGRPERLDADRFGVWLEVLVDTSPAIAAEKVANLDFEFLCAVFSGHLLVVDQEALAIAREVADFGFHGGEPEGGVGATEAEAIPEGGVGCEVGGYWVVARRENSWEAFADVLTSLEARYPALFGRLMVRCAALSTEFILDNGGLYDVLEPVEQVLDDVAAARDDRREGQGYVTAASAPAFLKAARQEPGPAAPPWDPGTARYFRGLEARTRSSGGAVERGVRALLGAVDVPNLVAAGPVPRPPRSGKVRGDGRRVLHERVSARS